MTYIDLINRFWQMNLEHSFTGNETQLYFKLLDTCNSLGWKNPFNHSNSYICGQIGMSEPTFLRARNKLAQVGLISFVSGKIKREKSIYSLLGLKNFTLNVTQSDTQSDTLNVTLNSEKPLDNIRLKKRQDNVLLKKEPKGKLKFSPPSLLEIKNEILEKNLLTVNPELFFNFYESKNWMVGKNKMQNWKKAIAGWESRNKEKTNQISQNGKPNNTIDKPVAGRQTADTIAKNLQGWG